MTTEVRYLSKDYITKVLSEIESESDSYQGEYIHLMNSDLGTVYKRISILEEFVRRITE